MQLALVFPVLREMASMPRRQDVCVREENNVRYQAEMLISNHSLIKVLLFNDESTDFLVLTGIAIFYLKRCCLYPWVFAPT